MNWQLVVCSVSIATNDKFGVSVGKETILRNAVDMTELYFEHLKNRKASQNKSLGNEN